MNLTVDGEIESNSVGGDGTGLELLSNHRPVNKDCSPCHACDWWTFPIRLTVRLRAIAWEEMELDWNY